MLNKINIDTSNYELVINKSSEYLIEITNDVKLKILIKEKQNATLNLLVKNSLIDIDLIIEKDSLLKLNLLGNNSSINFVSKVLDKASLKASFNLLTVKDSSNHFQIFHIGNYSNSNLLLNGVNNSFGKLYFTIDGIINKDLKEVVLNENSRIINLQDGDSKIIPNMIIDSNDVKANHAAYIGKFSKDTIYYLNSRGISMKEINKILTKGILLSNYDYSNQTSLEFQKFFETSLK